MKKRMEIVSLGECMVEMSRLPNGEWKQGFAGDTFNTAYYLKAQLGDKANVEYFTCVGDDLYSQKMLDFIAKNGIGIQYIGQIAGKRPGLYLIHQEGGDRHFTYWRENSAARHLADDHGLLHAVFINVDVIYFSGITLGILSAENRAVFLDVIKQTPAKYICFDPNIRPALWPDKQELAQVLAQAASLCDIVMPTYGDEAALMGDKTPEAMAARYLGYGAGEVVVKNGAGKALAVTEQVQVAYAAQQVDNVVDATGAGDSFNAAYLTARLQGEGLENALKAGHELAAAVIRTSGALIDKNVMACH